MRTPFLLQTSGQGTEEEHTTKVTNSVQVYFIFIYISRKMFVYLWKKWGKSFGILPITFHTCIMDEHFRDWKLLKGFICWKIRDSTSIFWKLKLTIDKIRNYYRVVDWRRPLYASKEINSRLVTIARVI